MTKSWNPRRGSKRYERAGAVVLNRVKLGQAPVSLHRIRWMRRGLWIFLVLAVVGGGVGLWLTVDSRFYVYGAKITGTRRLTQDEVFRASGLDGLHILWTHSGTIESRILEALPSLETAEVDCRFPSDCAITVVERRPRVLWDVNGELWWVDEDGAVFLAQAGGASEVAEGDLQILSEASGAWMVTGPLPRDDEGHLEEQARLALAELWRSGVDLPTAFQYSVEQGFSFVDEHGWRVIVGEGSGMARRLQMFNKLTKHLELLEVTPRFVDVRFPSAPYYAPVVE